MGAAVFDLNGLPQEYYVTRDSYDVSWVQTIFQALGLRSLITSSLQLDGFTHAMIHGDRYSAIIVKQRVTYLALLMRRVDVSDSTQAFVVWMQNFDPSSLKAYPRFSSI